MESNLSRTNFLKWFSLALYLIFCCRCWDKSLKDFNEILYVNFRVKMPQRMCKIYVPTKNFQNFVLPNHYEVSASIFRVIGAKRKMRQNEAKFVYSISKVHILNASYFSDLFTTQVDKKKTLVIQFKTLEISTSIVHKNCLIVLRLF